MSIGKTLATIVAISSFGISCSKSNNETSDTTKNIAPIGTWLALTSSPMPTSGGIATANMGRMGAVAMMINDLPYFGLGTTVTDSVTGTRVGLTDFWKYDGVWTQVASMPSGADRSYPSSFVIDYKAYVGAGYSFSKKTTLKDFYQYNSVSNSWTKEADIPFSSGRQQGFGFAIQGIGFIGGGRDDGSNSQSDVYSYNPLTENWAASTNFPGDKKYGASTFTYDNKAYIVGGMNSAGTLSTDFFSFNGQNWTQLRNIANLDSAKYDDQYTTITRANAAAFAIKGWAYLVGGQGNSTVWSYDITNDLWYPNTKLPIDASQISELSSISAVTDEGAGSAYLLLGSRQDATGYHSYNSGTTNFYQFTPGKQ